jgi:hypothetical protein
MYYGLASLNNQSSQLCDGGQMMQNAAGMQQFKDEGALCLWL